MNNIPFGDRLGRILDSRGISQSEFARQTQLSRMTIVEALNGRVPTGTTIIKMCNVLHVSADYLLGFTDKEQPYD